jgi:hypothetical protein
MIMDGQLSDLLVYAIIGALAFGIGLMSGYLIMHRYYEKRFIIIGEACEEADSLTPIFNEMERET